MRPGIALRNTVVLLRAGLRAYEWILILALRLPMLLHSGLVQNINSFTVAGAASALLSITRLNKRTDFPFHPKD